MIKQMKDVWIMGRPKKDEKKFGKHPTQKPEEIIERMIHASTKENDIVLDMFNGSGFVKINMVYKSYCELSRKRIKSAQSKNITIDYDVKPFLNGLVAKDS